MNFSKYYRTGYFVSASFIFLLMTIWLLRELGFVNLMWPRDLITPALLFAMLGLSCIILERGQQKSKADD